MTDRHRVVEELRKMKGLIEKDPEVKAQFDKNGDGNIDGFEWEQVRQLVMQRLEHEEAEAEEARRLAADADVDFAQETVATVGAIAEEIYHNDLSKASAPDPTRLDDCEDFVLRQEGGVGQLFESMVRREYTISTVSGQVLGMLHQAENQMLQELTNRSLFEQPDLHFVMTEPSEGRVAVFKWTEGFTSRRMDIRDGAEGQMGHVTYKPSLLNHIYRVVSTFDQGVLQVKAALYKPFTLDILNHLGEKIGTVHRGWSGLGGFLSGGNAMRIQIKPGFTSSGQRLGLLAAALLEDLRAEGSRKQ